MTRALALALALLAACGHGTAECVPPDGLTGQAQLRLIRGRADVCPMLIDDGADRPLGLDGEHLSDDHCAVEINRAGQGFHAWGGARQESAAPVVYLGKVDARVGGETCRYAWLWGEGDSVSRADVSWSY